MLPSHKTSGGLSLICVLVLALSLAVTGCGYAEVSKTAYELTIALDQAIDRKNQDQLNLAKDIIAKHHSEKNLSDQERDYLLAIIDQAEAGDWDDARTECRRLLQDQTDW